jgi:VanZ family protein
MSAAAVRDVRNGCGAGGSNITMGKKKDYNEAPLRVSYVAMFIKKTLQYLLKPLTFAPAVLVMIMIFQFSAQNADASSMQSIGITERLIHSINYRFDMDWTPAEQAMYVSWAEFYVRKLAHFCEYALLGFCLALPLYAYRIRKGWLLLTAQLICSLYAASDEFHQGFIPGRSPQVRDVLIDSAGAFVGILIGWLLAHIAARTVLRPLSLEKERRIRKEYYRRKKRKRR